MSDDSIAAGIELANELRAIAQALVDRDLTTEQIQAAHVHACKILSVLEGPPRKRWYEVDSPSTFSGDRSDETPNAFDALSPVRGRLNPIAPPLLLELEAPTHGEEEREGNGRIIGHARLSNAYEGPPRGVHGGLVAALFDEILGASMALAPPPGVTARLEVDYHHLTPVDEDLRLESRVVESRGRRVIAEATCHAGDTLTAKARAVFIRVDFKEVESRMRARAGDDDSKD